MPHSLVGQMLKF